MKELMSAGVSILVCCHNSAQRLPQTLAHLAAQQVTDDVVWELTVVDNASTDDTARVAQESWPQKGPAPLRVVFEPRLGLSHARHRGLAESNFDIVSFVDDDNWVCPEWVQVAHQVMSEHPEVAACGGLNEAVCEVTPPWWFEQRKIHYAVGVQGEEAGDITWTRGRLFGAGLTIRKSALQQLEQAGFRSLLTGRQGAALTAGEDYELCFALRLAGWHLWYEPHLRLSHYLPARRLTWGYLRRLHRGFGIASVGHDPYRFAQHSHPERLKGRLGRIWTWQARAALNELFLHRPKLLQLLRDPLEGDPDVLKIERLIGRLFELLRKRASYDQNIQAVWEAPWRRVAQNE